jgi:2-polyprenyl-3-methyl-5-hydroxy-6-metoxy-1,4-benzoquinol methylase
MKRNSLMRANDPTEATARPNDYDVAGARRLLWQAYRTSNLGQRLLAALRPSIARFDRVICHIPPEARTLDIGCGNGLLLALAQRYADLRLGIGIDRNAAAIAAARRMAVSLPIPLSFRLGATAEDWPAENFDVVMMIDVLHHIPQAARQAMIEAALGRVAPGGLFIYKDMCRRPVLRRLWNQLHDLILARQLVVVEPIENVIGWVTASGFAPVASERYVGAGLYGHELEVFGCPSAAT